jgi:hypothetical protein
MADEKKNIGAIAKLNLGKTYFSEVKLPIWSIS